MKKSILLSALATLMFSSAAFAGNLIQDPTSAVAASVLVRQSLENSANIVLGDKIDPKTDIKGFLHDLNTALEDNDPQFEVNIQSIRCAKGQDTKTRVDTICSIRIEEKGLVMKGESAFTLRVQVPPGGNVVLGIIEDIAD